MSGVPRVRTVARGGRVVSHRGQRAEGRYERVIRSESRCLRLKKTRSCRTAAASPSRTPCNATPAAQLAYWPRSRGRAVPALEEPPDTSTPSPHGFAGPRGPAQRKALPVGGCGRRRGRAAGGRKPLALATLGAIRRRRDMQRSAAGRRFRRLRWRPIAAPPAAPCRGDDGGEPIAVSDASLARERAAARPPPRRDRPRLERTSIPSDLSRDRRGAAEPPRPAATMARPPVSMPTAEKLKCPRLRSAPAGSSQRSHGRLTAAIPPPSAAGRASPAD